MDIKLLSNASTDAWNHYVNNHADGTFFHLAEWHRIIEQGLGHRCHYFYADDNGTIRGIFPLAHDKSWLFGNGLVSLPCCVYAGPIADNEDILTELKQAAVQLAEQLGVDYLESRNINAIGTDWQHKDLYATFIRELSTDHDDNMKAIPRKQRAMVRKAMKHNLDVTVDDDLQRFLFAYETSVRNLGTPIFPGKYFNLLAQVFADKMNLLTISHGAQTISSVMSFYYKDTVLPYYGGGTIDARKYSANDLMYWQLMIHAVDNGYRYFDFGRSKKGTGAFSFKKNWGFEPQDLHYQFYLPAGKTLPDKNPLNPKYQMFIKMWRKLPLPVARALGPYLARHLG